MDLDRLAEFAAIVKYGSIKKAALELGISSATLSARLIRFEDHLGTPLFCRSGECFTLTPAGQQLLPSALEILASCQKLHREICSAREHSYHQLRIAVCGTNLPLYLGLFLDHLNLSNPEMQIEIVDDSRYSIIEGLQSGAIDIYFAPVMEDFAPKGLSRNPVAFSTQFVIMPRNHRLAERSMVSLRELDGEPFLLYPRTAESAIRDFQLRNLDDAGIRYTAYDGNTSAIFYKLLIPIGKGLLLHPAPMMDLPPNTVAIPVTGLKHPATSCFFYDKANTKADVLAFARDFPAFAKEVSKHDHRPTL